MIAVPIVTVLIQEMSQTVISGVKRGTFKIADWTVMPKKGVLHHFLDGHPTLRDLLHRGRKNNNKHDGSDGSFPQQGFQLNKLDDSETQRNTEPSPPDELMTTTIAHKPDEQETEHDLARQLAIGIKSVAHDLRSATPKRYTYEEWAHFTKLIQFSHNSFNPKTKQPGYDNDNDDDDDDQEEQHLVEWDWIGEDSPMLADITEAEWVLDRLCESLTRYSRDRQGSVVVKMSSSSTMSPLATNNPFRDDLWGPPRAAVTIPEYGTTLGSNIDGEDERVLRGRRTRQNSRA